MYALLLARATVHYCRVAFYVTLNLINDKLVMAKTVYNKCLPIPNFCPSVGTRDGLLLPRRILCHLDLINDKFVMAKNVYLKRVVSQCRNRPAGVQTADIRPSAYRVSQRKMSVFSTP